MARNVLDIAKVSRMVRPDRPPAIEEPDRMGPASVRLVNGRGERDSPAANDLPITMRLAEPPEPFDWLRSA